MNQRERGGEAPVDQAPQAGALYGPAGDLLAYDNRRFRLGTGLVAGRNTRSPDRPAGAHNLANFGG
jgi:hypothetical protein